MKVFLAILTIIFSSSVSLSGQELAGDSIETEYFEFSVLGYGNTFFDGIFFEVEVDGEATKVPLAFHPDRRSIVYRANNDLRELRFFSEIENERGKIVRINRGKIRLEGASGRLLLLFREGNSDSGEGDFEIQVIDESEEEWGPGGFRFLNLTGGVLHCRLGRFSGEMQEGLSAIVQFPIDVENLLRLEFSVDVDGARRVVYATETLPEPTGGKLMVIKPPLEMGSLRVRVITIW